MEHAEHLAEAVAYTKDTFLQIEGLITWVKLFLAVIIPLLSGYAAATLFLQFIIKPILVNILVTPELGFTENAIAYMLQYPAVLIGILCIFLFPYYQGYLCRCMKDREIPKQLSFSGLFRTGWKINALILYYAIPLIVLLLLYAILFSYLNEALDIILAGEFAALSAVIDYTALAVYIILEILTFIFLSLFGCIGLVHLSRTGSLKESVNMGHIADIIRRIGWYDYILCIVIITIIILTILVFFLGLAGIFHYAPAANIIFSGLLLFFLIPTGIFVTRYLANIYDTAFVETEEDIEEFDDF
ncbi:MAG: DUF4013 domain-containing protein [Methanocorpusculum sp.]|nr:DUF4013 domain-containing protein [Methanocorpusculum sp.]